MRVFLRLLSFLSILSLFFKINSDLENPFIFDNKRHNDFVKKHIVFYAKKDANSNERIARKGVLVTRKNAPATVIILHGYGNNKFAVAPFRLFFNDYNCLTFDFRAHGENIEDQLCTVGYDEVYDLFAAADFLRSHQELKEKPIFIWAPSMGASTAIEAQAIDPNLCKAMFLDSPFPSSENIIKQGISNLKLGIFGYEFDMPGCSLLEKYAFNEYIQPVLKYLFKKMTHMDATKIDTFLKPIYPIESIKKINVPCFFVVGKNDEKVSPEDVTSIYNNHPGYKRLLITNGDHCNSVFIDPEKYCAIVNEFFQDVLNNEIYKKNKEIVMQDSDLD